MRIVITGASGNIGTALLGLLSERTDIDEVAAVARRVPGRRAEPPYTTARWLSCDIGAPGAAKTLTRVFDGADVVVHLAWAIQPLHRDPPMWRTNIKGSSHVIAAAQVAGVPHLVALSSVAAYEGADRRVRVTEKWPTTGVGSSAYSRHKAELERLLDMAERAATPLRVTRLRPAAVVQRVAASQILRYVFGPLFPIRSLGRGIRALPLDPSIRFQVVHSADVAEAIWRSITRRSVGAYNLAAEPVVGPEEVASVAGTRLVRTPIPGTRQIARLTWRLGVQPVHPGWLALFAEAPLVNTGRAAAGLGWRPRHSAIETLTELLSGMRSGVGTSSPPLRPRGSLPFRLGRVLTGATSTQSQDLAPSSPSGDFGSLCR